MDSSRRLTKQYEHLILQEVVMPRKNLRMTKRGGRDIIDLCEQGVAFQLLPYLVKIRYRDAGYPAKDGEVSLEIHAPR